MVAMILIRKDGHRRRVTRHAFDAHWSRLGYEVVAEPEPPKGKEERRTVCGRRGGEGTTAGGRRPRPTQPMRSSPKTWACRWRTSPPTLDAGYRVPAQRPTTGRRAAHPRARRRS